MATLNTRIVLRNDSTENWASANPTLMKGEIGIDTDLKKFKIGDGTTAWNDLQFAGGSDEIEVDASMVTFTKDFTATYEFGKYKPDAGTGSVVIDANGKTLEEFFTQALAEEKNPSVTQPTFTLKSNEAKAYEVGTNVTPKFNITFNKGKYEFGPDTGVTVTAYDVWTSGDDAHQSAASGTFKAIQVTEDTNYTITATVSHSDGANPKTNLGTEKAELKITAGTLPQQSTNKITGYRGQFYGYYNGSQAIPDAKAITSDQLRAFGVKTSMPTSLDTTQMKQMFFAAPKGTYTKIEVSNSVNGAPQTVSKAEVQVEGANRYEAIAYDLFYVSNAVAEDGSTKFTIKATR